MNFMLWPLSFVGPRPGAYENEEMLIKARESYVPSAFDVKPGITGYTQVYMKRQRFKRMIAKYNPQNNEKMYIIKK